MQQKRMPTDGSGGSVGYTFSFQIANDGCRRSCRVKVDAANMHDASALFREKWPVIEEMARGRIKIGAIDDGVIVIELP